MVCSIPEGNYDDPKGGDFRSAIYPQLRFHFQFLNEEWLLPEVHHRVKFSVNIYGTAQKPIGFDHIANLFNPSTVDACYVHDGSGLVGGIKNDEGKWNTSVTKSASFMWVKSSLLFLLSLYDDSGTLPRAARLPALHAETMLSVLKKLADSSRHIADIEDAYLLSTMWNERCSGMMAR